VVKRVSLFMANDDSVTTTQSGETQDPHASQFHLGYQRLEAEIKAVPDEELISVNLDVGKAIATVLGAIPEIRALRETIAGLPKFDLARFDKLQDYALALGHCHALYRAADVSSTELQTQLTEALTLRDRFQADAVALSQRSLLDPARVAKLRSGIGYKNVAFDVIGLVELFLESWNKVSSKTAVTEKELNDARLLANEIIAGLGLREQGPALVSAAAQLRQQAYTLFFKAYEEARRAVQFVRWHEGDAEEIAPSLFSNRARRPADSPAETDSTETNPAAPPSNTAGTGTIAGSTTSTSVPVVATTASVQTGATSTAPAASAGGANAIPQGFPGAAPFTRG
jgi:hypothetical protein